MSNNLFPAITFVNHASVMIEDEHVKLLSDPWYFGHVFHEGWSLIYENNENEILEILNKISHIWVSHEHPDHLSIPFFKKYKDLLKNKNIKFLFQETKDKRVVKFIKSLGLDITELKDGKEYWLAKNFSIKCIKYGFYDSSLLLNINEKKIYNINDCPLNSVKEIKLFKKKYGSCDVLLTQFSYAAWKGGKNNQTWRIKAANEKIKTIINQANILETKTVIPFASFIKFSNIRNSYLNKNRNIPDTVINEVNNKKFNVVILKPNEKQNLNNLVQDVKSLDFWKDEIIKSNNLDLIDYKNKYYFEELNISFLLYKKRIFAKNSFLLLNFLKLLPIIRPFKKIIIKVENIEKSIELDIFSKELTFTKLDYDIKLSSDSLNYIFNNSFGFDTLTVNGCFEQGNDNGFQKSSKLLAIENLNNLGVYFDLSILFNFKIILIFIKLLNKTRKNLKIS